MGKRSHVKLLAKKGGNATAPPHAVTVNGLLSVQLTGWNVFLLPIGDEYNAVFGWYHLRSICNPHENIYQVIHVCDPPGSFLFGHILVFLVFFDEAFPDVRPVCLAILLCVLLHGVVILSFVGVRVGLRAPLRHEYGRRGCPYSMLANTMQEPPGSHHKTVLQAWGLCPRPPA